MTKVAGWVERLRMVSPIQSLRAAHRGPECSTVRLRRAGFGAALLFLAAMLLFLPLQLFQVGIQLVQALFPETAVVLHPVGDLSQPSRLEPAGPPPFAAAPGEQACAFQHLPMPGPGGEGPYSKPRPVRPPPLP